MKGIKQKARSTTPRKTVPRTTVTLLGESPLVEEYGRLCSRRGYDVVVQWTSGPVPPKEGDAGYRRSGIVPSGTHLALELTNTDRDSKKKNIQKLDQALPPTAAILSTSITVSASEQSTWIHHRHRLVGFGAFPTFSDRPLVEVAPTVYSPTATLEVVQKFFASLGKECEYVQDRVGLVLPRVLCQLINEACFALQEDVATPEDIDTAMKLGVNHPFGPIEWADRIGFPQVFATLNALGEDLQEDRYRIAPLLRHMAQTGVWWDRRTQQA